VVIYSAVRSGSSGLGFVNDVRRLNVAITRARHAFFLVGSASTLENSQVWMALIADARRRNLLKDVHAADLNELIPWTLLDGSSLALSAPKHRSLVICDRASL